jgi:hypothetical protein
MPGDSEKPTVETLPLTDEQVLDAQIASALDVIVDVRFHIAGLENVLRELRQRIDPLERRLRAMQEVRKP